MAEGKIKRLMVCMPPGHAKSTYSSKLFPPWFFAQRPNLDMIGASHTSDLAEDFSSEIQRFIEQHEAILGYRLLSHNVKRWKTTNGGHYRAFGVGGSLSGRRADGGLIDDPVKSAEDAESETARAKVWQWYQADFYPRLKPDAWVVLVMTRWNEDDLGGRLLKHAQTGDGDQWVVLDLPAICDAVDDPLGRSIGAALWPEWQDEIALLGGTRPERIEPAVFALDGSMIVPERTIPMEQVAGVRRNVGEYIWGALYQQDPKPRGASFFNIDKLLVPVAGGLLDAFGHPLLEPVPTPTKCDTVFAVIDTAIKAGQEHNATAVAWCSYNSLTWPIPTLILDWDIIQIEGADQAAWLPSVHARGEELARACGARRGYSGAMIEDKATGTVLIQQSLNIARANGTRPLAHALNSKLTAMGKEQRAIAAAPYVVAEHVKITEFAFNKTKVHKGESANHLLKQVTDFRLGAKQKDGLDLLDVFCYCVLVTCAQNAGDRRGI